MKLIASLLLLLLSSTYICSQNYSYKQSFETSNPFVYWTSNATYTINYFGLTSERASDGSSCLKMDITINGNGSNECYYYWKLPVKTNLHGVLDFSADLYMDSITAQYVKIGYHYIFPPTTIERTPTASGVTGYNRWFTQSKRLSDDVIYHADYFAKNKIYGSTYEDFGREVQLIQLIIRGKGSRRLIFYIDNIQLTGDILSSDEYINYYTTHWADFQSRLSVIKQEKHTQFNSLPSIPDTSEKNVSLAGIAYYNQLIDLRADMTALFKIIDNSQYFDTAVMDSLNYKMNVFPSIVLLLNNEITNSTSAMNIYTFPSTVYNRLDEINLPSGLNTFENISLRMCKGEYEPFSLLLQAKNKTENIRVGWSDFAGLSGMIDSSVMDVSIAKVWYQAGITENEIDNKLLTQELLIKNDNLIKIDRSKGINYLLVKKSDGTEYYTDVSTPTALFPDNVTVEDSKILQPFSIEAGFNKQLWFTIKLPDNITPGNYQSTITISDKDVIYKTFNLTIEVLPFRLDPARLIYGIYYNGYLDNNLIKPFHFTNKTESQMRIELKDMKEHGILYPTTYQVYSNLDGDLRLRNEAGLPTDKLFAAGFKAGSPQTLDELNALKSLVSDWKAKISVYGYKNLYVYGIDEASGDLLKTQKQAWQAVQQCGANMFVAGYNDIITEMKDLIDAGVVFGTHDTQQSAMYHAVGKYILSYSNPQAGHENPEIYRRNFGFALWKSGYDGAMDYAYQKNYGSTWNDFDGTKYRDQNFTYPMSNGVLSTVQWEGFREGVDDVRYLSTLLNKLDNLKSSGVDVSAIENWILSIDPSGNLDNLRNEIIDKILQIIDISVPQVKSPEIADISFIDSTLLKVTFSKCIDASTIDLQNFSIEPSLQILSLKLSTDLKTLYIKTAPHRSYVQYNIEVNNLVDYYDSSPVITKSYQYSYNTLRTDLKVYLEGPFNTGSMTPSLHTFIPLEQPYNRAPWNYTGTEKITQVPSDMVDWVLVDLRSEMNTVVYSKAAILKSNGQIVDPDGSEHLNLYNYEPGRFFISIRHRNHLAIVSSVKWDINEVPSVIDMTKLTNINSKCPVIKLDETSYGLVTGDCDANSKIEIVDYRLIKRNLEQSGYLSGDVNLDGSVSDTDYRLVKNSLLKYSPVY